MSKDKKNQMATREEDPKVNLPVLYERASFLKSAAPTDDAFGMAIANQPQNDPGGFAFITINHRDGCFMVAGQPSDHVEGYVLHFLQMRGWWKAQYQPGSHEPPSCWSGFADRADARPSPLSREVQDKYCGSCKWAQFGSDALKRGQACRVNTFLFLANPEFGEPPLRCLVAPPSSIRTILGAGRNPGYLQQAKEFKGENGKPARYYQIVWTRFSLDPVEGAIHQILHPEPLFVCPSADEQTRLGKIRGDLMEAMERIRGNLTVVEEAERAAADGVQQQA